MTSFLGGWLPVWRLHRWVFVLWLIGVIGVVVEIVGIAAADLDSRGISTASLCGLIFQGVHQWIVARYERRDPRLSEAAV